MAVRYEEQANSTEYTDTQTRGKQFTCGAISRDVRVTGVIEEKKYTYSECICSLMYPAFIGHAPYCNM